jgi:hypothetical protein
VRIVAFAFFLAVGLVDGRAEDLLFSGNGGDRKGRAAVNLAAATANETDVRLD